MSINAFMTIGGANVHAPIDQALMHRCADCYADNSGDNSLIGVNSWLSFTDAHDHDVTVFMPLPIARAMAAAYREAVAEMESEAGAKP